LSNPVLIETNRRLKRIPVTVSATCTRKTGDYHFHDYTHIWYVLAGQLCHNVDDNVYVQNPGSCVVVPPFTAHKIDLSQSEDTPVVVDISFQDSFLLDRGYRFFSVPNRFEEYKIPKFRLLTGKEKENADKIMRAMLNEFSKHFDMSFDHIASLVSDFLHILCFEKATDSNFPLIQERVKLIMAAINYISRNIEKKITIDELCSICTMSRRMFTDNFKAITGMTVAQFIHSLRLNKARTLLMLSDKSISEIAIECGLYDKSHLIHAFTEHTGVSPTKYREQSKPLGISGKKEFDSRWGWLFENE